LDLNGERVVVDHEAMSSKQPGAEKWELAIVRNDFDFAQLAKPINEARETVELRFRAVGQSDFDQIDDGVVAAF
jgi:hypothetical protein